MTLGATITAAGLQERIEAESSRSPSERQLRIFDATVEFQERTRRSPSFPFQGGIPMLKAIFHRPVFVDHQGELSDPDSDHSLTLPGHGELQVALRKLGVNIDSTVVVYSSAHMMWATRLWWILRSGGLENVSVLDGGFMGWKKAGLPTNSGEEVLRGW